MSPSAACDEADVTARAHFRRDLVIDTKPDRSFVTQADTAIERRIRERLLDAFPDHGLVGEEYGTEAGDASVRWYIDPIDGTHNFIRGVPLFGTLLAVERDGELQASVLSAPALDERWWGWRGGGAWARNRGEAPRRIHVSRRDLARRRPDPVRVRAGHRRVRSGTRASRASCAMRWRERGFGDFWGYALVAEGAAEAMVEVGLSAWDAAAPMLLVEEAGGQATDFEGRRAIDSGTFLVTNGHAPRDRSTSRDRPIGGPACRSPFRSVPPKAARSSRRPTHRGRAADGSLSDPRALQILSTEHWSLLASRSLAYNEAFSRAGMFLSFLSATLIVIGFLIGTQGLSADVMPVVCDPVARPTCSSGWRRPAGSSRPVARNSIACGA